MNAPPDPAAADAVRELGHALERLGEALAMDADANEVIRDGTIQRFEFCVELLWKALKRLLELEGEQPKTPRQALQAAYRVEWIDDEQLWLNMLRDRNLTSHTYREALAKAIYANIRDYHPAMWALWERLANESGSLGDPP